LLNIWHDNLCHKDLDPNYAEILAASHKVTNDEMYIYNMHIALGDAQILWLETLCAIQYSDHAYIVNHSSMKKLKQPYAIELYIRCISHK